MPDGHFHVLIFSESKFYTIYKGETHFQISGLVAELNVFDYSCTTFGTFEKTYFNSFYPVDEYTRPQAIAPRDRGRVYSSSTVVCISLLLNRFKVLFGSLYPHIRFR